MIQFTLKCANDHQSDSWFQSSAAFEKLRASGMITCTVCGNSDMEKAVMAPRVQASRPKAGTAHPARPLSTAQTPTEQAMQDLRRRIEETSDYVGLNFAQQARDMHDGLTPERPIHGEARPEDAMRLIEDGVPVAPLPFVPGRKTN